MFVVGSYEPLHSHQKSPVAMVLFFVFCRLFCRRFFALFLSNAVYASPKISELLNLQLLKTFSSVSFMHFVVAHCSFVGKFPKFICLSFIRYSFIQVKVQALLGVTPVTPSNYFEPRHARSNLLHLITTPI